MPRWLDLDGWGRRHHFEFFRHYDQPFFGICADVDVTKLYETRRAPDPPSFFVAALYSSLKAANDIEEFRYRLRKDRVLIHDVIHGGSTVLRDDETFGFAYFDFDPDFSVFASGAGRILKEAQGSSGELDEQAERDDLIHYSVIPWVTFTAFSHAWRRKPDDSVPKIVFGKHFDGGGRRKMPVSVEVHHALMDGLHTGRFFDRFQNYLDDADALTEPGSGRGGGP